MRCGARNGLGQPAAALACLFAVLVGLQCVLVSNGLCVLAYMLVQQTVIRA